MNRKKFLQTLAVGTAAVAVSPATLLGAPKASGRKSGNRSIPELKISFQEGIAPGKTLAEQLDFMEKHGVTGLEPGARNLPGRVNELQQALRGRDVKIAAVSIGASGFILAEDPAVKREFDASIREIVAAAGELGAGAVVLIPGFKWEKPAFPHTQETRDYLVEQLRELGAYALQHNTTITLEPIQSKEGFFLRQIADAAAICRDVASDGIRCMGDFWHMRFEETSQYGAFHSGGPYCNHVHIASLGTRNMPGEDGELDDFTPGFRALQEIGYTGYIGFECGSKGDRAVTVPAAVELVRRQWNG